MEEVLQIKKKLFKADIKEILNEKVLQLLPKTYDKLELTFQSDSGIFKIDWSEKC